MIKTLSANETIPTDHWVYESIRQFKIAGYMESLENGNFSYNRGNIAVAIKNVKRESLESNTLKIEYDRLYKEFQYEISCVRKENRVVPNFRISSEFYNQYSTDDDYSIKSRLAGYVSFNDYFSMKYSAYLDNTLLDDPYYSGYDWRSLTGVQDQIYMSFHKDNMEMKFGRDYVKWGYGRGGNLMVSDNSRPFDMISLSLTSKYLSFQTFLTQLDQMYNAERYLTAIRFETKIKNKLFIGFGQCALYGGENRPVDFTISNPLAFYSFTQDNDGKSMNMMLYMDFAYNFLNSHRFYGELLVDDFQIDKEVTSDLEPNEIGFILGLESVEIIGGVGGYLEFTQVRNRTYNVPEQRPFEKFLHKNQYIGHQLGTDFQSIHCELDRWITSNIKAYLGWSFVRQGEGTIRGEFTTPYIEEDVTMETGYSESIPYGIVETTNRFYLKMLYQSSSLFRINCLIGYQSIDNYLNVDGSEDSSLWGQVNLDVFFYKGIDL